MARYGIKDVRVLFQLTLTSKVNSQFSVGESPMPPSGEKKRRGIWAWKNAGLAAKAKVGFINSDLLMKCLLV